MRRRPGIAGLQRDVATRVRCLFIRLQVRTIIRQGVYKAVGEHVNQTITQQAQSQLHTFRKSLEEFAIKHRYVHSMYTLMHISIRCCCRDDIRRNHVFRAQFHTMCANIGVDPLASNKGMWAQLLGLGDFYYQLGVQVIEACLATRAYNGGLIELQTLQQQVQVVDSGMLSLYIYNVSHSDVEALWQSQSAAMTWFGRWRSSRCWAAGSG